MLQLCYLWGAIVGAMGVMGWVRVRAEKGIVNFELGTSCKLAPAGGGTFVKDKNGNLVDVSQVPTQIIRMK